VVFARLSAAFALVQALFCLSAQNLSFIQMADPQFGMYTENTDFVQETANFEFAVASANRLRPSFVVVCGDLINRAGDAQQTAEYHRIAAKLNAAIRLYNVAGNHDVGNEPTPETLASYRKNFGRDYYTFRHGDFEGVVLNSSLIQHPEKAAEEAARQEQWAKDELAKAATARVKWVVVFQHIPWFLDSADEKDQYFNIPRQTRTRWLDMLRSYGVHYAFAGHYHRNAYAASNGFQMITTGPVGKPIGPDPSGIRIVIVQADVLQHEYHGFGNLPNKIEAAGTLQQTH
jgi:serine/threonine-protein phosphatase CPPED1